MPKPIYCLCGFGGKTKAPILHKEKPFKEIAQETGLTEKGVASAYYRSIKKLRAKMGDVE